MEIGKEKIKQSLFTDDMIVYAENPKESNKEKLLNLTAIIPRFQIQD